jgi:hypothetical protein
MADLPRWIDDPAVVARSTFPSQNVQNTRGSDHFGGSDVEKVYAVVARSTLRSHTTYREGEIDS